MRKWLLAVAAASSLGFAAFGASAADFSFTGTFNDDDDVQFFNFNVGALSTVTLRTYSYAGGTNAEGDVIARGGFDPILTLYNSLGVRVGQNDDGDCSEVGTDSVTGVCYDTFFQANLAAGSYSVAVSQFSNFGPATLAGSFPGSGTDNFEDFTGDFRDGHWAFDVLNVESAAVVAVPEPATWAIMIMGFGAAGAVLRRRRSALA